MQKEILTLTSLRFGAAFYVFLFHIQLYFPFLKHGEIARLLNKGAAGMSIFFILSGFVLGYRFHDGVNDYKKYAFDRFTRIYPAYFLAALVTLPWLITSLPFNDGFQTLRFAYVIFTNILMLQAWVPQFFTVWNNGGSWSLSVEMFFYALFPFIIYHLKKLKNKQLLIVLCFLYITSSLPGISLFLFNPTLNIVFYSIPIFRVSEFIIGIICGLLYSRGFRVTHPSSCAALCLIQLYYHFVWGEQAYAHIAMAQNFITVPFITLLIFSLASMTSGPFYRFMISKHFVYLGRISYSFYSFQALVLMIIISNYRVITGHFTLLAYRVILTSIALVVLVAISAISHHFVENKFRNYLKKKYNSTPQDIPSQTLSII